MTKFQSALTCILKSFFRNGFVLTTLAGCTSMVAHTSIDPYISNKEKRDKLELLAEQYCQEKQSVADRNNPAKLPDYLFTTDGCSRWFDDSWVSCCVAHDITYWCGGSNEDRAEADQIFKQCINQKAALMGGMMHLGVRVGGSPWLPTPWRWGYGWKKWPKGYQEDSKHQAVNSIFDKLHIPETIDDQLKQIK
jgi:hypothetical protein